MLAGVYGFPETEILDQCAAFHTEVFTNRLLALLPIHFPMQLANSQIVFYAASPIAGPLEDSMEGVRA